MGKLMSAIEKRASRHQSTGRPSIFMAPDKETYPRPDFHRTDQRWTSLNGPWRFHFDDQDSGLTQQWHRDGLPDDATRIIQVPFVFQAPASGINERGIHEVLWYERHIADSRSIEEKARNDRVVLRFGAVDYEATVWVSGEFVGFHRGGHVPFDLDITDALSQNGFAPGTQQRLAVRVFDSAKDVTQPRGKQFWGPEPEGIFYTPSSGIWQAVWTEILPSTRIADSSHGTVLKSNDIEGGELHALVSVQGRRAGHTYTVQLESRFEGLLVGQTQREELPITQRVSMEVPMRLSKEHLESLATSLFQEAHIADERCWLNGTALWSPEHPLLYDVTLRLFDSAGNVVDEVQTTTGMRSLSWNNKDGSFRLNNQPYFHALLLDQGYWPSTLMTPPSPSTLKNDIELSKIMGFNGCRKHQKVEDPAFMYWADRLGFLVWGEMASAYQFSKEYVDRFNGEWMEMVQRDINHPCVVAWTLANESWGYGGLGESTEERNHLRTLYYMTKTLDPTRPINDNCGWEHVRTDLSTFHDYADARGMSERCSSITDIFGRGKRLWLDPIADVDEGSSHTLGAPILCTEFGGVNISMAGRDTQHAKGWGYTSATDAKDLLMRIQNLCMAVVNEGHCCGFVYTQLTDIEQETNGLYTYDRKEKLPAAQMKEVIDMAAATYYSHHPQSQAHRSLYRASLSTSCRNIHLEGSQYLVADCAVDAEGQQRVSGRIDLNDCLHNSWGKLGWARGGNFKASARNIRLADDGHALEAELGDGKGRWLHSKVQLDERIRNQNGRLLLM